MPDRPKLPHEHPSEMLPYHFAGHKYYSELIRIVTILFVGVLALMTFLLTVGYQRPHANFSWALYSAIVVLGLNLLAYVLGHLMFVQHLSLKFEGSAKAKPVEDKADGEDKDDDDAKDDKEKSEFSTKKSLSPLERSKRRLAVMRVVQQVLFVLAVVAVVWLALATANFFFTIPQTPGAAQ